MKIITRFYSLIVFVLLVNVSVSCNTEMEGNTKNSESTENRIEGGNVESGQESYVSDEANLMENDKGVDEVLSQENKSTNETPKAESNIADKKSTNASPQDNKTATAEANTFFKDADKFFGKNVSNGKVNYKSIKNNRSELNELVSTIGKYSYKEKTANERKAFLINAYNILTIKNVVDNYPIKQPTDVDGFFKKVKHNVGGDKLTLDEIENKKIRDDFKDARIHFVLVCAAQSCPPIINKAYTPDNVNSLLETQTNKAVNSNYFIEVDKGSKTVTVSMIMKWYKEDFVKGGQDEIAFLNKYRDDKIPADYSIKYKEYNWDLNKE